MRRIAALLVAAVLLGGAGPMTLQCSVPPGPDGTSPDWGRAFIVTVPFGEGAGLALVDAETQRPIRMAYAADVLDGRFQSGAEDIPLIWTRATSARAPLIGQAIRSDGHILTLSIDRAIQGQAVRIARLHDTKAKTTWSADCSASTR